MMTMYLDHWRSEQLPYGWVGECRIALTTNDYYEIYNKLMRWIPKNINYYRSNMQWRLDNKYMYFRFRKSEDMLRFKLTWPTS